MSAIDLPDGARTDAQARRAAASAALVSDICEAIVHAAPEFSEAHDALAPLVSLPSSTSQQAQVLEFMVNNRRCHVRQDDTPGGTIEHLDSLNLGGYSLDRVDKKLGKALGQAVYAHGLGKLYLSGNAFRTLDGALEWLLVENDNGDDEAAPAALTEVFVDSNMIRAVEWPPTALTGVSKCLAHLDLSRNKIRSIDVVAAPLPRPITLHALEWLDLSGNIKLEQLPDGLFGSMPNLKRLDAYSCALKAVPDDISDCRDLVHCGLHSNELSVLPSGLFECRKIVWLSLNMNKLSALPDGIGNLKALERLSLHQNLLTTLPAAIGECIKLEALSVHHNRLETLPDDAMSNLKACFRLSLYENFSLGHVPPGVCGMTGLRELWLYDCGLTSLNTDISNLTSLQKLWLDKNPGLVMDEAAWAALKSLGASLQELYLDGQVEQGEKSRREQELRDAMQHLQTLKL